MSADGQAPTSQDPAATDEPASPFERTLVGLSEIAQVAIDQAVTKACQKRGVPNAQRDAVRDVVITQWHEVMDPRDPLVQALVAGYVDIRTSRTPPSREQLTDWGKLAGELYDRHKLRVEVRKEKLRGDLDGDQRLRIELEISVMDALSEMSQTHIERWRHGEFKDNEFWHPPTEPPLTATTPVRGNLGTAPTATTTTPDDPIGLELSAWSAYVEDFIRRYRLDDGQRNAAHSCLAELTLRANQHRERYRLELAALERRMQSSATSVEIEETITRDIVKLYGPVDDMFTELRDRLEHIPTGKQREANDRAPTP